jgi:hypothetical protein
MAYQILRTNGSTLTTIQDGTINTTSTSLQLPGRNKAGYGQALNQNFVRIIENFSSDTPPPNPLKGQLWYNTSTGTLNVCPGDGITNGASWSTLTSTSSGSSLVTLGSLDVTNDVAIHGNLTVDNDIIGDTILVRLATVTDTTTTGVINATSGTINSLTSQTITTGAAATAGTLTGTWAVIGSTSGNAFRTTGNIAFTASTYGIKSDNYMYANGASFTPTGTYSDSNVSTYLTDTNVSGFKGNIAPTKVTTSYLGAPGGGGTVSGVWTLATGARFEATYADLAERFEADAEYEPGTVVELGGEKEITAVIDDLSEAVFGVVSNTAAMLMNSQKGYTDKTHPPIAIGGRVKVKIKGPVKKGDRLVSAGNGYARAAVTGELTAFNTIGRSLGDKLDDIDGVVEAVVMLK